MNEVLDVSTKFIPSQPGAGTVGDILPNVPRYGQNLQETWEQVLLP